MKHRSIKAALCLLMGAYMIDVAVAQTRLTIPQLNSGAAISDADLFVVYQGSLPELSVSASQIASYIAGKIAGTGLAQSGGVLNLQPAASGVIGGVESKTCSTHQWLNVLSATPSCGQPASTDLSDSSSVAHLGVAQSFTKAQRGTPVNITISTSTFTPNFDNSQNFEIDLVHASCPCTLANPSTTLVAGQSGMIEIHQSSTGGDSIGTWGSDYQYVGGTATITLSTAANAVDYLPYFVNNAATGIVLGGLLLKPVH